MARLEWIEELAEDGSVSAAHTKQRDRRDRSRPRYSLLPIRSARTGQVVEWYLAWSPMVATEERVDVVPVEDWVQDTETIVVEVPDSDGELELVHQPRVREDGEPYMVLQAVQDEDGYPQTVETRWEEIIEDTAPSGHPDLEHMKQLAQAHETGGKEYGVMLAERKAATAGRRAEVAADQRRTQIAEIVSDPELIAALKAALAVGD